jgi:hypothetical protein
MIFLPFNLYAAESDQPEIEKLVLNLVSVQADQSDFYLESNSMLVFLNTNHMNGSQKAEATLISSYLNRGFTFSSSSVTAGYYSINECWFDLELVSKNQPSVSLRFGFDTEAWYIDQQKVKNDAGKSFQEAYSAQYREALNFCIQHDYGKQPG